MIHFFGNVSSKIFTVQTTKELSTETISKLTWLFGEQPKINETSLELSFVGPRAAMITPWSTNAVEITQNMGISDIIRIEEFDVVSADYSDFDPMISQKYSGLGQDSFTIDIQPEPILDIEDIAAYNEKEGLALSSEEVEYLESVATKIGRKLTDSEVFGFSQVNSEHCRHKIFNGTFVIDGEEMPTSLFKLIKETAKQFPNDIVSAYKDNVAFIKGPKVEQFAPKTADKPDFYETKEFESVISLKAETHNFPTTVEPFNGAATGSGGEIRDRLAGGKGSLPLAGTAVYMTSYSRLEASIDSVKNTRFWENKFEARDWLYQTPMDILIKASNGASDFGNKFGQPLITGSVLTFEHEENTASSDAKPRKLGFDKVIMQAGGIGYAKADQALKDTPKKGDKIVILGGENYRIGMGGAAVSSADTGEFASGIELNAVQRSNPEMQKRAANAVRGMVESDENFIVSIHDHGAGGHLNCLSELVEDTGGKINLDNLPVGDPTLSAKEIIGNESQERMGLVIAEKHIDTLQKIAERERSPIYTVGDVTGDDRFTFESETKGDKPMDLALEDMFGSSPKTVLTDKTIVRKYKNSRYKTKNLPIYLAQVLQLEAVGCKDWLTNKVDRCVGGKVAKQQCVGSLQIPLNNVGVMALDYNGKEGIATSIGHSPISGLINPAAGSRNSIAESLTNIIWAPLKDNLASVSLSANWMWPCKNEGEDARLYKAVKAISDLSINLGINVPTGKDSLSMKQKYKDDEVISPGTVIISATANCDNISKVVEPVLQKNGERIYYINISQDSFKLGGSSFNQVLNTIGNEAPDVTNPTFLKDAFNTIQNLIKADKISAGHDVASGGLLTTLLEMCFADVNLGADFDISSLNEEDSLKVLFAENAGIVFQADASVETILSENNIEFFTIGTANDSGKVTIKNNEDNFSFDVSQVRDTWYKTSYLLDDKQTANGLAKNRFDNYKNQPLKYTFPANFTGKIADVLGDNSSADKKDKPKAAIIREKGSNSEREMANAMYLAGFDVKDVHMTDLISGRETLEDIQFIGAVGGFSNSDVLGSAKGWAGAFLYNEKANTALKNFFKREDTLSVGICNGAQLWMELDLINPDHKVHGRLVHNDSKKHESSFTSVKIQENNSVMLSSLAGTELGVWISHGEGKFNLPEAETNYSIVAKYGYEGYPNNPNGSDYNTAMLCDATGRHLVTMPHIERSTFQWNWANYPADRKDEVSPWLEAFVNAKTWIENKK
ncbi:phosphoribosylformylglycinamidine synthase [Tenacibaculum finnmarkense]|uniref:phosphoribosylformylglycinamidine synthase n=1 Tax=Tenacibaculum finnmarkense TaxID=2781243 RepID=UPI001E574171|nr:phosphoribosylformylglycinamidine synthase [Tenacibaculum finnmarkense]MCD8400750.1 phosphoribosylformylglycinamidine synthase [Tenacibaculum finnmarkense genomovar ulcerans]MCG8785848.1 phosphoribosylformylglycinamidine synthase [Tenacibaculum finnmarkense]MCG8796016.1 phosphoribosylformylglycinamidine synthase [Tenacibaculum finnmarkense]MCG8798448.1 phosphoribosylformylglycinamidine synthase [Tenacibaculum finnmarkense]MCG8813436.1 phosphoribosylformylglycinamidine synthase [Tenacibaculu